MKTQILFTGSWIQTAPIPTTDPSRPKLRYTQPAAFSSLKNADRAILNAPTGWGKSLVIVFLVCYHLLKHKNSRCIIAVPQTLVARNFVQDWRLKIPGVRKLVDWVIQHNLCHEQSKATVDSTVAFLRGRHSSFGDRILLCTHATLAHTYKRLKRQRKLSLLKNTLLWIDEAHHVMNAQTTTQQTISNSIGALVKYCVASGNPIGLATATFMRGDMRHILPEKTLETFTRFDVPYDVYFETAQPVKTFSFNIVCGETQQALRKLFRKTCPTILYLAKRQSRYAGACKYAEVKQVIAQIAKIRRAKIRKDEILTYVGSLRILDLVTEKNRSKRKDYLNNGGEVDIILALDTCKEGFDWPQVERSIILGERHSVPEMIQMIGRLFRRAEGKKHAEVYQILPAAVSNSESFKDQRNSILTVIFSAMLLEDVFIPLAISPGKRQRDRTDRLVSAIPDTEVWQALSRDFLVAVQDRDYDTSWKLAPSILKRHGIAESDYEFVWHRLWTRYALVTRKIKGLRLNVPFEILKKTKLDDGILTLASGLCGKMTFQELRRVIGRETKTIEEWVLVAEELEKKHGTLPNPRWLQQNGYRGLYEAIRNHPEHFQRIKQDQRYKRKTLKEWHTIAKRLEKKYKLLPRVRWLQQNGWGGLNSVMRNHPEHFKRIKQDRIKTRTLEEWHTIAKRLEKKYKSLPHSAWLQQNGYKRLANLIHEHPEHFKHIKQNNKKHKTLEEHLATAKNLEKQYGTLPHTNWLRQNGYNGLDQAMRKHRGLFKHIKQDHKRKTLEEHVAIAKKLEKKYKKLPNPQWLKQNGYQDLNYAIRKHPEYFKSIKQRYRNTVITL